MSQEVEKVGSWKILEAIAIAIIERHWKLA